MLLNEGSATFLAQAGHRSHTQLPNFVFWSTPHCPFRSSSQAKLLSQTTSVGSFWLKTVRVAPAPFSKALMRLCVRHGLMGEVALTMEGVERATLGWDIMTRMASVLKLVSPFQVVLYADNSSVIQVPMKALQLDTKASEATLCYIVQTVQVPTAQQYQDLMTAIYHKDVMELSYLLGKGLDLTCLTMDGGHTSSLVTVAILRDHSSDPYAYQPSAGHCFPRHGASLTYLLLQAQADPNILPPKLQPTTMMELAVELGSSQLVQVLLEAGASVIPIEGAPPPLFLAVLHRHRAIIQLLLEAQADPWQEIAIASVLSHPLQVFGRAARKEVFNAVQAAATQSEEDTVLDMLLQIGDTTEDARGEQPSQVQIKPFVLTERATVIMKQTVWRYQHIIEKQSRQTKFTTYRWRRIFEGLYLPVRIRNELQPPPELNRAETFLHQVD